MESPLYAVILEDGSLGHPFLDTTRDRKRLRRLEVLIRGAAPGGLVPEEVDELMAVACCTLAAIDAMERTRPSCDRLARVLLQARIDAVLVVEATYRELETYVYSGVR